MGFGKPVIRIHVDGDDVVVNSALTKVRRVIKKTDTARVENRRIVVELADRHAESALPGIKRRIKQSLDGYHVDFESDDD